MLASIIAATAYLMAQDHTNAEEQARRHAENLVRAYEESVARVIKSADNVALQVRRAYERDPAEIDLVAFVNDPTLRTDLTFQFSITRRDGVIVASSYAPSTVGLSIADRIHFRVQADSGEDRLYVSNPLISHSSGNMAIFLTRRLLAPDGSFNGVLSVWIDLIQFEKFFRPLDLGEDGSVSLMNLDGYMLASGANGEVRRDVIGKYFPQAGVLKKIATSERGVYWNTGSAIDRIRRMVAYTQVKGLPLVAVVGVAESEVFRHATQNARIYWGIDSIALSVILIAVGFGAARERKLTTAAAAIAHQAHHDALTELPNRVLFRKHVDDAMARARGAGERFNLLMLDLDHFKAINDTLGHAFGDLLVKAVARRLKACLSASDIVARIGGDEFAVLQAARVDQAARDDQGAVAAALAKRILETIGEPFDLDGHHVIVETSIGVALYPADGVEAEELLKHADLALYRAKSDGRNAFRLFEPGMDSEAQARYDIEVDLRSAIPRHEFEVYYQPLVDAASAEVTGCEALVRWNHPQHGLVAPDKFISIAESTGLIVPLGEWVLRRACADAAAWPPHIKIAVNLSPIQFRKGDIVDVVASALSESGLPADRLEVEITESVLLQKNESNLSKLHRLRRLGVSIVLDDFGTGYSSLSYLLTFPFDKVKIDRSFVADMSTRSDCASIVCAITGLAKSLDMTTTAEGVETPEQLDLLRAAGCNQMQGYLFGRPCPASALRLDRIGHCTPETQVA
jgi:diguanylate cyclase (GGDEF)-like protein